MQTLTPQDKASLKRLYAALARFCDDPLDPDLMDLQRNAKRLYGKVSEALSAGAERAESN